MNNKFSTLGINILGSKGQTGENIEATQTTGITCKSDFTTVGGAQTLSNV